MPDNARSTGQSQRSDGEQTPSLRGLLLTVEALRLALGTGLGLFGLMGVIAPWVR